MIIFCLLFIIFQTILDCYFYYRIKLIDDDIDCLYTDYSNVLKNTFSKDKKIINLEDFIC